MNTFIETMTDAQQYTLRAAADWTEACLALTERQTLLSIEASRTTLEQSFELALLCRQACRPENMPATWLGLGMLLTAPGASQVE